MHTAHVSDTPTLTHKLYIHNSTHLHTCVYAYTHVCGHMSMCSHTIHMHACIHMCTHIHAHTQGHNLCRKSSTGYNTSKSPAFGQAFDSYFESLRYLVFPQAEKREVSNMVAGSVLRGFDLQRQSTCHQESGDPLPSNPLSELPGFRLHGLFLLTFNLFQSEGRGHMAFFSSLL